ncbi:alcohol dehydrogenase GroES domain protein [Hypoxylon trugodes]|uniref:alcohol dehydrogenase GroES domain protein n=1 Tax=Hypoxylon trugodes TaxID=326681 RepID=UPI0021A1EF1A|nr:alcohol dehydrogenase GroES domain protein [Hypoxylon trugodes]KAI1392372.1 alcohol dehydrogenase GroES domain protein [Hypoxylon trugodes]
MKAFKLAQWGQPGQYVEVPKPEPGPADVLIRVKAAGLCRSDLDMVDNLPGDPPYANSLEPGYILGHENAGYVVKVGSAVTDLKPGDPVVVHHMRHCGNCEHCTDGAEQHCDAFKRGAIGMTRGCGMDGGLAEFMVAPRSEVIFLGEGVDPIQYAPLTDAGVTAYHAIRMVADRLKPGNSIAIIGVGGLGSYAVQFAKLLSAAHVIAIDIKIPRLTKATELGADEVAHFFDRSGEGTAQMIMDRTKGRGIDVIVDFVGSADTLKLAAKVSRPRGRIVLVGMQGGTLEVGWGLLATSCEFMISLGSTRQDLREVCELTKAGKLTIDIERFAFEELDKAYEALRFGTLWGRAVVVFP